MLISKFYNQANKSKQQQQTTKGANNSRILTPSSIPIFVLPPTLEHFNAQSFKPELNGKYC